MTKEFCDRCGELIVNHHHSHSDVGWVENPSGEVLTNGKRQSFSVEFNVVYPYVQLHSLRLCYDCRDAVIDQAYQFLLKERKKRADKEEQTK